MAARSYQFSFGPWNISQGADPFGPPVRKEVAFGRGAHARGRRKMPFECLSASTNGEILTVASAARSI